MAGAIIGPLVGSVASGIFGGGDGGGAPPPTPSASPVGNTLAGIFSGLGLAGIGPMSKEDLQAGAAAADPFAPQRGQYQGALQGTVSNLENLSAGAPDAVMGYFGSLKPALVGGSQVGQLSGYTGTAGVDSRLMGLTANQSMNPALTAMGVNDPSMGFRYQQGLDAVTRGAAATGALGSGQLGVELEQYGQNFASQEFQNQFQRQMGLQQLGNQMQQANWAQGMGLQQLYNQTQQQNWGQMFGLQGLYDQEFQNQAQRVLQGTQVAMGMQGQQFSEVSGLGGLLSTLSGATTGSPAMAGKIQVGGYGQSQDNLANLIRSVSSMFPGSMGGGSGLPTPSLGGYSGTNPGDWGSTYQAQPIPSYDSSTGSYDLSNFNFGGTYDQNNPF